MVDPSLSCLPGGKILQRPILKKGHFQMAACGGIRGCNDLHPLQAKLSAAA